MRSALHNRGIAANCGSLLADSYSPLCVLLQDALDLSLHHQAHSKLWARKLPVHKSVPKWYAVDTSKECPGMDECLYFMHFLSPQQLQDDAIYVAVI